MRHTYKFIFALGTFFILATLGIFALGGTAPGAFPAESIVAIPTGATLAETADILFAQQAIRSESVFKIAVALLGGRSGVKAGDYLLEKPQSAFVIAYRIVHNLHDLPTVKVTIPEGLDSSEIATILFKTIPGFDAPGFLAIAKKQEGFLFPDTYFFYKGATPTEVVQAMRDDFDARTSKIAPQVYAYEKSSGASASDILKMASIIEKEASTSFDRRMIAGILWKRLSAGMPLQVDATFGYLLNKGSSQLTVDDLRTVSPYNLYTNKGLPPTPIGNPGISAILDTVQPTTSKYWFYLSDAKGAIHYAATLDEHIANRQKYLRK